MKRALVFLAFSACLQPVDELRPSGDAGTGGGSNVGGGGGSTLGGGGGSTPNEEGRLGTGTLTTLDVETRVQPPGSVRIGCP